MTVEWISLLTFVVLTTFTPGPNNISSASMGILFGYRSTFKYLIGIASGFVIVMFLSALMSAAMYSLIHSAEKWLRIIGAAYILWLAWHSLKADYDFNESDNSKINSFKEGFTLQLVNPKVIIYGLTLFSTFLAPLNDNFISLFPFPFIFAFIAFCSISSWTMFGVAIRKYLKNRILKRIVNTALALALAYTAVDLSGLFSYL